MSMNGNKNNLLLPESAATQCVTTSLVRGHPGPALASISNKQSFPEVKDEKKGEKVLRTIPAHTASPRLCPIGHRLARDYPRTHGVTRGQSLRGAGPRGLSPHTRRHLVFVEESPCRLGTIPAHTASPLRRYGRGPTVSTVHVRPEPHTCRMSGDPLVRGFSRR